MKIAVFTSNHPRHLSLLEMLTLAGHEVTAVIEPKPWVSPISTALNLYWARVNIAEQHVFGPKRLMRVPAMIVPMGELSQLTHLPPQLFEAPRWVIFGSSFIRGWLLQEALERNALNLHAGIAPEYRGSAPNFWAEYDKHPELVGAQVQALSPALDGGSILAEYRPPPEETPWVRGMLAVQGGITAMIHQVALDPKDWRAVRVNDPRHVVRYARYADFTEAVVSQYLARLA